MNIDPLSYPIVFRVIGGKIELSQPDLQIYRAHQDFDQIVNREQLGGALLEMITEVTKRLSLLKAKRHLQVQVPVPSGPTGARAASFKDLLSVKGASLILGTSESTIRRLCEAGKLPFSLTLGKHRRIELSALLGLKAALKEARQLPDEKPSN
jgi:excisionase family DNA binding protein